MTGTGICGMEKWISAYESLTSLKRGKIGPRLQSRPNRKCHTRFCLVPKSTTLKDLEGSLCFKTYTTIDPLQQAQNAVARLLGLSRRDHVRPALKELHRLPVVYRIQFKLALVMFTIHTRRFLPSFLPSFLPCNELSQSGWHGHWQYLLCHSHQHTSVD